jgi:hypothetical protein
MRDPELVQLFSKINAQDLMKGGDLTAGTGA